MTEKPPVLSDEEMVSVIEQAPKPCPMEFKDEPKIRAVAQAQRDADVAHYEPLIQQAKEEGKQYVLDNLEKNEYVQGIAHKWLEQAKAEVAREIFEWGNEPCPHQFYANTKQQCRACWDELRNKVFGNPSSPNT